MQLATIARFREALDAHLLRTVLDNEGIPAVITNEHLVGVNWLYSDAVGGVEVRVHPDDVDQAVSMLRQYDDAQEDPAVDDHAVPSCAACGSTSTRVVRGWLVVRILAVITVLALSAVMIPLMIVALPLAARFRRIACEACGHSAAAPRLRQGS